MKIRLKYAFAALCVLLVACLQGCVKENLSNEDKPDGNSVAFYVNTKSAIQASNLKINDIRIIITKENDVVYNKTTKDGGLVDEGGTSGESIFKLALMPNTYTIYVIANETSAMQGVLANVLRKDRIDDLRIAAPAGTLFSGENIPLVEFKQFVLKSPKGGNNGSVVVDGVESSDLQIKLKRAHAKLEFNVRKYTQDNAPILLKSVELGHVPMYSYLRPKAYSNNSVFQALTLNEDGVGDVSMPNDVTEEQFNMVDDSQLANAGYQSVQLKNNIFPEYIPEVKSNSLDAMYLNIYGTYDGKEVVYRFNIRNSLGVEDYSIFRNVVYKVWLTITQIGEINGFKLYIEVKDWVEESIDVDNRAPFLNVSDIAVSNADNLNTARVYFWTNQSIEKQTIEAKCYKQNGSTKEELNLSNTFVGLIDPDKSNFHTFVTGNTPSEVNYNGYIDFVLTDTAKSDGTYYVTLNAGGLKREITINYTF